jgi:hypothetical protein
MQLAADFLQVMAGLARHIAAPASRARLLAGLRGEGDGWR